MTRFSARIPTFSRSFHPTVFRRWLLSGSRKYKDLDAYLLPQSAWQRRLSELSPDLPETFDAFWAATEPQLTGQLREVEDLLSKGALSSVAVQRGKPRIGKVVLRRWPITASWDLVHGKT